MNQETSSGPEEVRKITKCVHGYWVISILDLGFGGPEEGGWWYLRREPIAALPGRRTATLVPMWSNRDDELEEIEWCPPKVPEYVDTVAHIIAEERGAKLNDQEYRSARPRWDTLTIDWHEPADGSLRTALQPPQRPHYE